MTAIDQTVADMGLTLPEVITGHVAGQSVAIDPHAGRHAVNFPGTGEHIASLQEDDLVQQQYIFQYGIMNLKILLY